VRDMSINLPTWAWYEGYRLEGDLGTVGDLYLYRDGTLVRAWRHPEEAPNIFELEEFLEGLEQGVNGITPGQG